MSPRTLSAACLVSILSLAACRASGSQADWTYGGATGPEHWGDLKPEYVLAKSGRRQSPVDIASTVAADLDPIQIDYHETTLDVINNGHTVEDNYHSGGSISVGEHVYALAQFHFHSPSEHTIDGEHFPMEMHLVHRDAGGKLAVVAVLIAEGEEHLEFARLGAHVPKEPGRATAVEGMHVNAADLLPESLASYRYSGSLTTPPCSEDVSWFVLQEPIQGSREQIRKFRDIYFGNNRPTQPLNGRVVSASR